MKKVIYSGYSKCNYCLLRIIIICYDKKRKQEKTLRSKMTLVIGNDLVHLRLARHMDTKSEISTGLISFATLIWVVIASLTENSLPSHIILKFHLACDADAERDPSGEKNKNLSC